jgi:hypothetical protein
MASEQPVSPSAMASAEGSEGGHAPRLGRRRAGWWVLLCLGLAGAGAGSYFRFRPPLKLPPQATAQSQPARIETAPIPAASNAPSTLLTPPAALPPKSTQDLKVGPVRLEKAKGSSLVYAVGTLRNESPHQRFGVKLELELTGPDGRKVGLAKDYRSVLEPKQEWNFRALVLDAKAVSAKVASIREDE